MTAGSDLWQQPALGAARVQRQSPKFFYYQQRANRAPPWANGQSYFGCFARLRDVAPHHSTRTRGWIRARTAAQSRTVQANGLGASRAARIADDILILFQVDQKVGRFLVRPIALFGLFE